MSHRDSKDNPPAYKPPAYDVSASHAVTAGSRAIPAIAPNHTTLASTLLSSSKNGTFTTSQYLESTFSLMVRCQGRFEPVVVAIDEDYDRLVSDLDRIFRQYLSSTGKSLRLDKMIVVWEEGWKDSWKSYDSDYVYRKWHSDVKPGNLVAMLRLIKAQNDRSYVEIS